MAAGDILLHLDLVRIRQTGVAVNFLLQNAQLVPDPHEFVEEYIHRHFLGLESRVRRMEHGAAFEPAEAQFVDDRIRLFMAQFGHHSLHCGFYKLLQRYLQAGKRSGRFGRFHAAQFGIHGAEGVVKSNLCSFFSDAPDHSSSILRVSHSQADCQSLNLHASNITCPAGISVKKSGEIGFVKTLPTDDVPGWAQFGRAIFDNKVKTML